MNGSVNGNSTYESLPNLRDTAFGRAVEVATALGAVGVNGFVILVISLAKTEPLASPSFNSVAYLLGVFAVGAIVPNLGLHKYLGVTYGIFGIWLPQLHINALLALIRVLAVWKPLEFAAYVAGRPWRKHIAFFVAAVALFFATVGSFLYDGRFSVKVNPKVAPYVLVASIPALVFVPTTVVLILSKISGKDAPIGQSQKALTRNLCLITLVDWAAHVLLFASRSSVPALARTVGPDWFRAIIAMTSTMQDFATVIVYLSMSSALRESCWKVATKGVWSRKIEPGRTGNHDTTEPRSQTKRAVQAWTNNG